MVGTDVLCAKGPLCEWLRVVVAPQKFAGRIQQITFASSIDRGLDCHFPNVRRVSIALSLLRDQHIGQLIFVLGHWGGPQLPLHVDIFNDSPLKRLLISFAPSERIERLGSTAFYFLASKDNLRSLSVKATLLPRCLVKAAKWHTGLRAQASAELVRPVCAIGTRTDA
jgi:hypothetical protein